MHFEITNSNGAAPRLERRRAFKDWRGTEFSPLRECDRRRARKARRRSRKAQRGRGAVGRRDSSSGGQEAGREGRALVTVIPRDGTLIGNYAEQFEFHGSGGIRRQLRFQLRLATRPPSPPPSSLDRLCTSSPAPACHPRAISILSRRERAAPNSEFRPKNRSRTRDGRAGKALCSTLPRIGIPSSRCKRRFPQYSNIWKTSKKTSNIGERFLARNRSEILGGIDVSS